MQEGDEQADEPGRFTRAFGQHLDIAGHTPGAVAALAQGAGFQIRAQQVQQFGAPAGAGQHPLPTQGRAHVADGDVRQGIGVVETGQAGGGEDALQLVHGEVDKVDPLPLAVLVAEPEAEVRHEFVMDHRLRRAGDGLEKELLVLVGDIVAAGDADDVQPLQAQFRLRLTQDLHLAAGANDRQTADAGSPHLVQQAQAGGQAGLVAHAGSHLRRGAGEDRPGLEAGARLGPGQDHRLHLAPLQQTGRQGGDHARPLGTGHRTPQPQDRLLPEDAKAHLIPGLAPPAMQTHFLLLQAVAHKETGLGHARSQVAVAETTVAAQPRPAAQPPIVAHQADIVETF